MTHRLDAKLLNWMIHANSEPIRQAGAPMGWHSSAQDIATLFKAIFGLFLSLKQRQAHVNILIY